MNTQIVSDKRTTRSPNGCNAKPIALALRADEKAEVEKLAEQDSRSKAAMARVLVLEALEARRVESAHPALVSH